MDGASLCVDFGRGVSSEIVKLVERSLSGYESSSADPQARLRFTGTDPVTIQSTLLVPLPSASASTSIPFSDPLSVVRTDYVVFAVGEWIDATSLVFGRRGLTRVHAASFIDADRVWMIAGPSNAGKTSLTLEAVGRGARYLTDERVTVGSCRGRPRISGLARPLRLRNSASTPTESAVAGMSVVGGSDGFRRVVYCDELIERGGVDQGWVTPTDLLVLGDAPVEGCSRSWVLVRLIEQSMNAIELGPECLEDLARLVCSVRLHVARPRTLGTVADLGDALFEPLESRSGLLNPATTVRDGSQTVESAISTVVIRPGVRTVDVGSECLLWIPQETTNPIVIGLDGSAAEVWRRLAGGQASSGLAESPEFLEQLQRHGAVQRTPRIDQGGP